MKNTIAPQDSHDPLLDAIQAYEAGNAAFESIKEIDWPAHGGEQAVIAKTYGPALDAILKWEEPATTLEGAVSALRFALEDIAMPSDSTIGSMVAAALGYLEARQ